MNTVGTIVIAVLVALVAALSLPPGQSFAAPDKLTIDSLTLDVGQEGSTLLEASEIAQPGVGAWTLDISYDPGVVAVIDCVGMEGTVCLTDFGPETIRITGASASGLDPEVTLARFDFRCEEEGVSNLSIHVEIWARATIGVPQPPPELDIEEGTITCVGPSEPTATEEAASTPAAGLPSTGRWHGRSSGPIMVVAALVAMGATALLSAAALRARG